MDIFWGLVASGSWGINNVFVASISRKHGPFITGLTVQFFALLLTLIFLTPSAAFRFPVASRIPLIISGILSGILYYGFCLALTRGQASIVTPINQTWIVFASLLGFIFFHDTVSPAKILALPLVLIGIIFLSLDLKAVGRVGLQKLVPGALLAIVIAIGFSVTQFLNTIGTREIGAVPTVTIVRILTVITLLATLPLTHKKLSFERPFVAKTFGSSILDTVAFTAFNLAVVSGRFSALSLLQGLTPIVSIVGARLFLEERLTNIQKLAALGTIAGVCLFQV